MKKEERDILVDKLRKLRNEGYTEINLRSSSEALKKELLKVCEKIEAEAHQIERKIEKKKEELSLVKERIEKTTTQPLLTPATTTTSTKENAMTTSNTVNPSNTTNTKENTMTNDFVYINPKTVAFIQATLRAVAENFEDDGRTSEERIEARSVATKNLINCLQELGALVVTVVVLVITLVANLVAEATKFGANEAKVKAGDLITQEVVKVADNVTEKVKFVQKKTEPVRKEIAEAVEVASYVCDQVQVASDILFPQENIDSAFEGIGYSTGVAVNCARVVFTVGAQVVAQTPGYLWANKVAILDTVFCLN